MSDVRPQKVLYVHLGGGVGGAPLSMIQLARSLPTDELEPVLVFSADGPIVRHARDLGLRTRVVPFTDSLFYGAHTPFQLSMIVRFLASFPLVTKRLGQVIAEEQPSLVHLNTIVLVQAAVAAHRQDVPVIWHVREVLGDLAPMRAVQTRLISQLATRIISNSNASGAPFLKSGKLTRIYNGVNTEVFRPGSADERAEVRAELGLPDDALVIGLVGSVQAPKGHFVMLDAFADLCQRFPSLRLLIVAGGTPEGYAQSLKGRVKKALRRPYGLLEDLLERAERRGLRDRIVVTGYRLDVQRMLLAMDTLVFPSQKPEGFGRPIVEAMAAGVPVVAINVGASPELVLHGETGLLAPPDDPQALADAAGWILARPDLRAAMGRAGRARACQTFSEAVYVESVINLYRQVLRQPKPAMGVSDPW
ncbi:MAG: glycosyltransferase family 4 protein [Chloroflexota bacterium]